MAGELVVFITCSSKEEGTRIGRKLVEEKLAACVNLIPSVVSFFSWKGSIHEDKEVLLIVKTRKARYQKLERRVKKLHSYTVPEVIGLPILVGSKSYMNWVREMTRERG